MYHAVCGSTFISEDEQWTLTITPNTIDLSTMTFTLTGPIPEQTHDENEIIIFGNVEMIAIDISIFSTSIWIEASFSSTDATQIHYTNKSISWTFNSVDYNQLTNVSSWVMNVNEDASLTLTRKTTTCTVIDGWNNTSWTFLSINYNNCFNYISYLQLGFPCNLFGEALLANIPMTSKVSGLSFEPNLTLQLDNSSCILQTSHFFNGVLGTSGRLAYNHATGYVACIFDGDAVQLNSDISTVDCIAIAIPYNFGFYPSGCTL